MTLPITGARRSGSPRKRGFTLIELLLVITLIAVLSSVAMPRLSASARAARLERQAEALAELIRFARAEAVRRQLKVRLNARADGSAYWLRVQDAEYSMHEQFVAFGDSFLDGLQELPGGFRVVIADAGRGLEDVRTLELMPSGVGEPCVVELHDGRGRKATVALGIWFDEVRLEYGQSELAAPIVP